MFTGEQLARMAFLTVVTRKGAVRTALGTNIVGTEMKKCGGGYAATQELVDKFLNEKEVEEFEEALLRAIRML